MDWKPLRKAPALMPWTNISHPYNSRKETVRVMDRIVALDAKPAYLYNGGAFWPRADAPDRTQAHLQR